MRYALGLVIWLLTTSGLFAADQTKSKTSPDQPQPLQMGILIGGKTWDMADTYPDKARKNSQKAVLYAPSIEAITGFLLTDPNNYGLQYTCSYSYRETPLNRELDSDKTETVQAGTPCPNVPHNTQSLYIKSLKVEFTGKAKGPIQISCRLYDINPPGTMTLTDTDPAPPLPPAPPPELAVPPGFIFIPFPVHPHHYVHATYRRHRIGAAHRSHPVYVAPTVPVQPVVVVAPSTSPTEPSSPTPCATTRTSQRIIGVEISLQPPPPPPSVQLGIFLKDTGWQLSNSSPDAADNSVSTVKFQTTDQPIFGFSLKHQTQDDSQKTQDDNQKTQDDNQKPKNAFSYTCVYSGSAKELTVDEGKPCPDPTTAADKDDKDYVTSLSVTDTDKDKIKVTCTLYNADGKKTAATTPPDPCQATKYTPQIVGVQISVPSPPPPPPLLTMDILASGIWNQTPSFSGITDGGDQKFELSTSGAREPIVGFFLRNETAAVGFNYKCVFRDTVNKRNVTKPVSAGEPCIGDTADAKLLYLKELSIEPTGDPAAKITLSCTLSDSAKPVSPCKTVTDSQRIVGVQVEIQRPPQQP